MANKEAHKNTIKITLDYKEGSVVPDGVGVKTHATTLDAILGVVRLFEIAYEKAKADGKTITEFIASCAKAYAEYNEIADDDDDDDDDDED